MADSEPQKIDEEPPKQSFQTDEYVESSVNPDSIKQRVIMQSKCP